MEETQFWKLIEEAWNTQPKLSTLRTKLCIEPNPEQRSNIGYRLEEAFEDFVLSALTARLENLSREKLLAFDRIAEHKLYKMDRKEIHNYTDGSDDGFLYCRGFILAMGQKYYEAVDADPSKAIFDLESESMTYIAFHMLHDKFEDYIWTNSGISRESCSNHSGW